MSSLKVLIETATALYKAWEKSRYFDSIGWRYSKLEKFTKLLPPATMVNDVDLAKNILEIINAEFKAANIVIGQVKLETSPAETKAEEISTDADELISEFENINTSEDPGPLVSYTAAIENDDDKTRWVKLFKILHACASSLLDKKEVESENIPDLDERISALWPKYNTLFGSLDSHALLKSQVEAFIQNQETIQELENDKLELEKEKDELQLLMNDLNIEYSNQIQALNITLDENSAYQNDLVIKFQQQIVAKEAIIQEKETTIEQMEKKIGEHKEFINKNIVYQKSLINNLQEVITDQHQRINTAEADTAKLAAELSTVQSMSVGLKDQLEKLQVDNMKLIQDADAERIAQTTLRSDLTCSSVVRETLEKELAASREVRETLEKELATRRDESGRLQEQLASILEANNKTLTSVQSDLTSLRAAHQTSETELFGSKKYIKTLQKELSDNTSLAAKLTKANTELQGSNNVADVKIKSLNSTITALQDKALTSSNTIDRLHEEISQLKKEITSSKATHITDSNQLKEAKRNISELDKEINDLKKKSLTLASSKDALQKSNTSLTEKLNTANKTIDDVQNKVKLLETSLEGFEQANAALQSQLEDANRELILANLTKKSAAEKKPSPKTSPVLSTSNNTLYGKKGATNVANSASLPEPVAFKTTLGTYRKQ